VQKERLLRRGIQRWMGWKSEKTIECYDHSFTEREEEETFAAFQREVEQELTASRLSSKQTTKRQTKELRQPSLQSAAVSQAIADLDFWKDEL
jgi:hypothetical protein